MELSKDEIISLAREAGFEVNYYKSLESEEVVSFDPIITYNLERFAALVAAHVKSDQINTAYQQGCEDMKRRMEKRMQQLEAQLQLCQTAVADEREACAKVCEEYERQAREKLEVSAQPFKDCAAAIRARSNK